MYLMMSTTHVVPWSAKPIGEPTSSVFDRKAAVYKGFLDACIQAKNCNAFIIFGAWDPVSPQDKRYKDVFGRVQGPFYASILGANLKPKAALKACVDEANAVIK